MQDKVTVESALASFSERILGDVKILMIEDDVFLSELVMEKLSLDGCIPYSSPNGEEGLSLAEQYQPDIVILDLMLPGIPGEEVLIKMKSSETLKHIPVIVFSNKSDESDIKQNLASGAIDYLVKSSTDLRDLPRIIKRALGK